MDSYVIIIKLLENVLIQGILVRHTIWRQANNNIIECDQFDLIIKKPLHVSVLKRPFSEGAQNKHNTPYKPQHTT
jgi:hypothetical protein